MFVAKLSLFGYPDGRTATRAIWPFGVNNGLIPDVEEIAFVSDAPDIIVVPAATAWEVTAGCYEPVPRLQPRRTRILSWPDDHMDRLRQHAIAIVPRRPDRAG